MKNNTHQKIKHNTLQTQKNTTTTKHPIFFLSKIAIFTQKYLKTDSIQDSVIDIAREFKRYMLICTWLKYTFVCLS